jgi:hypothetical protein
MKDIRGDSLSLRWIVLPAALLLSLAAAAEGQKAARDLTEAGQRVGQMQGDAWGIGARVAVSDDDDRP